MRSQNFGARVFFASSYQNLGPHSHACSSTAAMTSPRNAIPNHMLMVVLMFSSDLGANRMPYPGRTESLRNARGDARRRSASLERARLARVDRDLLRDHAPVVP